VETDSGESISPSIVAGSPRAQYYIAGGVRRSVAAREMGHSDIAAKIVEPGKPDILTRINLDQLHSPRPSVARDGRYLSIERDMKARAIIIPIEVQPLGLPGQLPTVKLANVQLQ
jgi:hypothetical protein